MTLKIQPASTEELEEEFGSSTSGNDPETVRFILGLEIGQGFTAQAESGETDRMVKRRINACAKEAFRELDWRVKADGKTLVARVKAVDVEEQNKAQAKAEEEAKAKANGKAPESPEKGSADKPGTNGAQGAQTPPREPTKASA